MRLANEAWSPVAGFALTPHETITGARRMAAMDGISEADHDAEVKALMDETIADGNEIIAAGRGDFHSIMAGTGLRRAAVSSTTTPARPIRSVA